MRIKHVSCNQFAGIRDRSISFTDGVNVICGKNESGKSTLVNLISRTLFQNAKLDRRKDKEFFELYFPGARKGSPIAGDFADGKITFETEDGTYTLSKEWGADPRAMLSTPNGMIRDQRRIAEILADALLYGEGVYSDMLFSSQRNTDVSLQTLLDASKKTDAKQEIASAVSQAFAESDGISVDAIEQAIDEKIDSIAGKHWDFDRDAPLRKAGRWSTGLGEILKVYYRLEDARDALQKISDLERDADLAARDYAEKDDMAQSAEEAYTRFQTFSSRLAVQNERRKAIERIRKELGRIEEVLVAWPQLNEKLAKAKTLKQERADRTVVDLWEFVNEARSGLSDGDYAASGLPRPESREIADAKRFQRDIARLENTLCGMNLNAAIQMLGGNEVHIVSLRTGETVDISGGIAAITEAVKITVPGVMEMQLSPADVDVTSVEEQIARLKEKLAEIFGAYNVDTLEKLEAYAQKIDDARAKIEQVNARIARALGSISLEQLEELYRQAGPADRCAEDINRDILDICGRTDLTVYITKTETILDGYAAEYGSINDLKAKAFDCTAELQVAEKSVAGVEDIPAEYLRIADPDAHLGALQENLQFRLDLREAALTKKTAAAGKLDNYKEEHPEACAETVEKAAQSFAEVKSLLHHWLHIREVFRAQKDRIHDSPMADIASHFTRCLSIISGGRVSSEFPDGDRLEMNIYSGSNLLDYGKLSEGTKETVSLAFRLAVLEHLFPEGGGVIVLDDPFTDMDAERTAQSCALIQECAKRHQVIFLTCNEKYLDILGGNRILV